MSIEDDEIPCETEEQLLTRLDYARQEFLQSILALETIMHDVPSNLPAPDGVYRIRNCAKARDVAYAKYKAVLKSFKDRSGDRAS